MCFGFELALPRTLPNGDTPLALPALLTLCDARFRLNSIHQGSAPVSIYNLQYSEWMLFPLV